MFSPIAVTLMALQLVAGYRTFFSNITWVTFGHFESLGPKRSFDMCSLCLAFTLMALQLPGAVCFQFFTWVTLTNLSHFGLILQKVADTGVFINVTSTLTDTGPFIERIFCLKSVFLFCFWLLLFLCPKTTHNEKK